MNIFCAVVDCASVVLGQSAEEYIRAKVARYMNDEYELFTHDHTSKCVVTFVLRCAAAS